MKSSQHANHICWLSQLLCSNFAGITSEYFNFFLFFFVEVQVNYSTISSLFFSLTVLRAWGESECIIAVWTKKGSGSRRELVRDTPCLVPISSIFNLFNPFEEIESQSHATTLPSGEHRCVTSQKNGCEGDYSRPISREEQTASILVNYSQYKIT